MSDTPLRYRAEVDLGSAIGNLSQLRDSLGQVTAATKASGEASEKVADTERANARATADHQVKIQQFAGALTMAGAELNKVDTTLGAIVQTGGRAARMSGSSGPTASRRRCRSA